MFFFENVAWNKIGFYSLLLFAGVIVSALLYFSKNIILKFIIGLVKIVWMLVRGLFKAAYKSISMMIPFVIKLLMSIIALFGRSLPGMIAIAVVAIILIFMIVKLLF